MSKSASAFGGYCRPDGGSLVATGSSGSERICERIRRENPESARRVAQTIYDACATLRDFPNLGPASKRMAGRRELVFSRLPYVVVYQVTQQAVEISRVFHGAQDWP